MHANDRKKEAAEHARLNAGKKGGGKPAPSHLVGLHLEKAWPPTAWPRAIRMLVAGAVSGAVSKTATAPIETVRLNVMVGSSKSVDAVVTSLVKTQGVGGLFRARTHMRYPA